MDLAVDSYVFVSFALRSFATQLWGIIIGCFFIQHIICSVNLLHGLFQRSEWVKLDAMFFVKTAHRWDSRGINQPHLCHVFDQLRIRTTRASPSHENCWGFLYANWQYAMWFWQAGWDWFTSRLSFTFDDNDVSWATAEQTEYRYR